VRHLPRSVNHVEGEEAEVECHVYGWPLPILSWRRGDQPLNGSSDSRISVVNSTLKISNLRTDDRDNYECVATSTVDDIVYEESSSTLIRVKGKYKHGYSLCFVCC